MIKNVKDTDREPSVGKTWIKYWMWTAGQELTKCPGCGTPLNENKDIELCKQENGEIKFLSKKAEGAHIRLLENDEKEKQWSNKIYIVPMCHGCNCRFGEGFEIVKGTEDIIAVEEKYKSES